ncbi:MAG: hypothetical protein HKN49_10080, partial [Gammaproteobacteria bacterium]|nr:hypothetical protein [Gammaproteobacteria bacterium]
GLDANGAVAWDEMQLNVVRDAAFDVVYPNGGETWASGTTETVQWTMTNTDVAPINTSLVDILISTDGGASYDLLVANVPNDGAHDVVVPAASTTDAIIKVRAADNVYFEISADTFTITAPDGDLDGIIDTEDNCPAIANADQLDSDTDNVGDVCDNCTVVANASQCDTNGDGFGNACDADLDNNNIVNSFDLSLLRDAFGSSGVNDADLNCNGIVNSFDLTEMRNAFGTNPGPSAFAP